MARPKKPLPNLKPEDFAALAEKASKGISLFPANPRTEFGITERQEQFCQIYALGDVTGYEAARKAGYKAAAAAATMLLNGRDYPRVIERIQMLKDQLSTRYGVTFENHVTRMAEIRDAALQAGNFTAAVAAEKSRGQAAGLYVTRSEILVGKIDQMSREEVLAEIARIQSEFPVLIEGAFKDVTPETETLEVVPDGPVLDIED